MKLVAISRGCAAAFACVGLVFPPGAYAAGPAGSSRDGRQGQAGVSPADGVARDVALHGGGTLRGQVLDPQGMVQAGVEVTVRQAGQVLQTQTDAEGMFQLQGLRGGVYVIEAAETGGVFRCWAPQTAPPAAGELALLVTEDDVVRGRRKRRRSPLRLLANPWVLGAAAGAAIAIPLTRDRKPAS